MKATEKKIIDFFSEQDIFFNIPVYQRDYNWQEKQCGVLFKDILKAGKDSNIISHFLGSIVYIYDGVYRIGYEKEIDIIDGQQRLITLTIMFVALYRKFLAFSSRKAERIYEQYLVNKHTERETNLKLVPPEENLYILKSIIEDNYIELDRYRDRNLVKNYKYFVDKFETFDEKDLGKFLDGIEKLIYVDISLEKGKDDPQKIFESLNSTGLDLTQADLIRNYILMDLNRDEQNRIYKNIWLVIEKNCKITDGDKIENYTSDFMRDYLTLKNNKIPVKTKVFEEFKKFFVDREQLEEIKLYSYSYSCILNPNEIKDSELELELGYLKSLNQTVINSFLIGIIKDYFDRVLEKDVLKEILQILQSYLWRRYIVGEPSNSLNTIFQNLYSKISIVENKIEVLENILLEQKFPDDEELKHCLKTKSIYRDREKVNYLFRRIENYSHNEVIDFDNEKITIEHIFPQKPNKDWKERYTENELEAMMSYKDTISNLTLTGSNSNLSNKSFEVKRDEKIHGYKDSKLYLNQYLGKIERWDLVHMEERFEILYKDIVKIWKRPILKEIVDIKNVTFLLNGKDTFGSGKLLSSNKFEILKGSTFATVIQDKNLAKKIEKIIIELLNRGILERVKDKYILKENYKATSPSLAAELVLGRSANGWQEWKTFEGKSLKNFK